MKKWRYRVISAERMAGPWRRTKEAARKDAVELGLGGYDEAGQWFDTVPGRIQTAERE